MIEREQEHIGAQLHLLGPPGDGGQGHQLRGLITVVDKVMLRGPAMGEAYLFSVDDLLENFAVELAIGDIEGERLAEIVPHSKSGGLSHCMSPPGLSPPSLANARLPPVAPCTPAKTQPSRPLSFLLDRIQEFI